MFIAIEYYIYHHKDRILYGKSISLSELKKQISKVECLYDRESDNFVELFCRMYGWQEVDTIPCGEKVTYTYDRDVEKVF